MTAEISFGDASASGLKLVGRVLPLLLPLPPGSG
jgi:hypothetical protein